MAVSVALAPSALAGPLTPELETAWNKAGAEFRTAYFAEAYNTLTPWVGAGESLDDPDLRQAFYYDHARIACMTTGIGETQDVLARAQAFRQTLPLRPGTSIPTGVFFSFSVESLGFGTHSDYRRGWGTIARSPYQTSGLYSGPYATGTASTFTGPGGVSLWDVRMPYRDDPSTIAGSYLPGIGAGPNDGTANDVNGSGTWDRCYEGAQLDAYVVGKYTQTVGVDPKGNLDIEIACATTCAGKIEVRRPAPGQWPGDNEQVLGGGEYPRMTGELIATKSYSVSKRRSFVRLKVGKKTRQRIVVKRGKFETFVGIVPADANRFAWHRRHVYLRGQKKLRRIPAAITERLDLTLRATGMTAGKVAGLGCEHGRYKGKLSMNAADIGKGKPLRIYCGTARLDLIIWMGKLVPYSGRGRFSGYAHGEPNIHGKVSDGGRKMRITGKMTKSTGREDPFTART